MRVVIVGAGGHGKVVLDILRTSKQHQVIGFLDANESLHGRMIMGIPVLGALNQLSRLRSQRIEGAIVAIGDNAARLATAAEVSQSGLTLISAIHPTATISPTARLGKNVVIAANATLCVDTTIGDSVILNTACVVDHECIVEEGVHICPGALLAGRVQVGRAAMVGMGARVIQCLQIGPNAIIGAGAVVLEDVPANTTVVGVPARPIR